MINISISNFFSTVMCFLVVLLACQRDQAEAKPASDEHAEVTKVSLLGDEGKYQFSVTIKSPDTGCGQYADWWEVITPDGELIYRRILTHSHVEEQPFTRHGGPVNINAKDSVIVRAHMNNLGYGPQAMSGSPVGGFNVILLDTEFAGDLLSKEPLPDPCRF